MTKRPLYIIGAGSVGGHLALNIEEYSQEFKIGGFFDDDPRKMGTVPFGFKVLGTIDDVIRLKKADIVIGIAFPKIKKKIFERLSTCRSLRYPTLIHERAWISKEVSIGKGCVIYPGTTINFGSIIEDFVVLNVNCSLGHHTKIGRYSSFAPGVNTGGHTSICESADVGIGTSTLQNIVIGADTIVGGQSMIIKPVEPGTTVTGVPAKKMSPKNYLRDCEGGNA